MVLNNVSSFMNRGKFEYDKMSPMAIGIYLLITVMILVSIFANSFTFQPVFQFQCSNYVLNTYLYFLLTWSLSLVVVHVLDTMFTNKGQKLVDSPIFRNWHIIMIMFIVVFVLMMIFRNSFYIQHVFFFLWIILVGCMLFMLFSKNRAVFYQAIGSAFAILVIFTFISVKNPGLISPSMMFYLVAALVALIIARVVELFLYMFNVIDIQKSRQSSRIMSYIAIVIFTLFIIYDTNSIRTGASSCNMRNNPPNYIGSSTGIFLDTLNLVTNIFNLRD
jgi:FtsH-binding integral membrane protein